MIYSQGIIYKKSLKFVSLTGLSVKADSSLQRFQKNFLFSPVNFFNAQNYEIEALIDDILCSV